MHAHGGAESGPLLLAWAADPAALVLVPMAALLYARGIRSLGGRLRFHDGWRPPLFYLGLLVAFVALVGPLDHIAEELFLAHMVQHVLLVLVAVPLVLLGAPVIPMMRGVPRIIRRGVLIPLLQARVVRGFLRLVSHPLVAWPLFVGTFLGLHFPLVFQAAAESEPLHVFEHGTFALGAYLFWWNVIDPLPLKPNLPYLARVPYIFMTVIPTFVLGAFLTYAPDAWYAVYEASAARYGLTGLEDQQLGGVIMWIPGSFVMGTALVLVLAVAVRREQEEQLAREAGQGTALRPLARDNREASRTPTERSPER